MEKSGVYKIQSKIKSERIYIGSSVRINNRWKLHIKSLQDGKHGNQKLQRHYNKYGESDLQFIIIEECERNNLLKVEQLFIDSLNPYFNICKIAGSPMGRIIKEESRMKMREAWKKRKPITKKQLKIRSMSHIGQKVSDETKEKHRIHMLNNKNALGSRRTEKQKMEKSKAVKKWWKERNANRKHNE